MHAIRRSSLQQAVFAFETLAIYECRSKCPWILKGWHLLVQISKWKLNFKGCSSVKASVTLVNSTVWRCQAPALHTLPGLVTREVSTPGNLFKAPKDESHDQKWLNDKWDVSDPIIPVSGAYYDKENSLISQLPNTSPANKANLVGSNGQAAKGGDRRASEGNPSQAGLELQLVRPGQWKMHGSSDATSGYAATFDTYRCPPTSQGISKGELRAESHPKSHHLFHFTLFWPEHPKKQNIIYGSKRLIEKNMSSNPGWSTLSQSHLQHVVVASWTRCNLPSYDALVIQRGLGLIHFWAAGKLPGTVHTHTLSQHANQRRVHSDHVAPPYPCSTESWSLLPMQTSHSACASHLARGSKTIKKQRGPQIDVLLCRFTKWIQMGVLNFFDPYS